MGSECSGHASSSRSPSSSGPVAYYNPAPPWLAGCAWAPAPRGPVWVCKSSEHAGRLASPPLSSSTDAGAAGAGVSSRHRAASVQVNDTALHRAWLQTAVDGFLTRQHCEGTWCAFKEELSHDGWGNVAPLTSPLCVCRGCSPILPACPHARTLARGTRGCFLLPRLPIGLARLARPGCAMLPCAHAALRSIVHLCFA